MKKFIFALATFVAISLNTIGQSGWTMVDSGLPVGIGVGQISVGMNDNTALWGLAINNDGSIYDAFTRSTNGGNTWEAGTFNAGNGLSQLFAIDADVCWAVFNTGADQGLYKTEDGGVTWVKKGDAYGSGSFANVIHFFDDMNGFAQGDPVDGYYELYVTTDGGENWTRIDELNIPAPTSGEYGITGNYCAVGDNIWWGTNQGRIFRSTDKGYNWEVSMTVFGAAETVSSLMFDELNGFAFRSYLNLGIEAVLNETNDGGVTWTEIYTVGASYARYFYHVPGTVNTVIGSAMDPTNGMGISISENGGHNWTEISAGYEFQASAWLDLETGWCGTFTTAKSSGGMYIYGEEPPLAPPTNLQGTSSGYVVNLTWDPPSSGTTEELIYDNNVNTGAYSYNGYTMSTHMSPAGPCQVLTLKYYTSIQPGDNTFNATVFDWDGSQPGTTIIYEETVTAVDEDWMLVDVSAQNISFTGDFVVGFGSINATTFLGFDAGLNNGRSWDFNNSTSTWATWNEAYLIRAIVLYPDGSVAEIGAFPAMGKIKFASGNLSTHPTDYSGVTTVKPIDKIVSSTKDFLGYNVYRDGVIINSSLVLTEEYEDIVTASGLYEYYVTAVYDEGESGPSNIITLDVITAINEISGNTIQIYPNPVIDYINVKSDSKIISVELMNLMGQRIIIQKVNELTHQINLTDLQSGIYIVKVELENSTVTRRIAVN
ncbi:MAG: T9SS type A sorting domain-containing protein [Bacteroidales bacterium]|nr:T9SS type A sorting domain-containing protein [Bacteroidales bacterium]